MTDNPHQSAHGTGIAQAYGEGATATVNITGLNPEQIASLLQAAGAAAQAIAGTFSPHLLQRITRRPLRNSILGTSSSLVPTAGLPIIQKLPVVAWQLLYDL